MLVPGMEMNDETVRLMMFRYSDSDTLTNLSFPGFITLMIRMDRMFSECTTLLTLRNQAFVLSNESS